MAILPAGTTLPPWPYAVALAVAAVAVGAGITRRRPAVTETRVVALAPWMALGSALHALYVLEALPSAVAPFAGTPAVYVSVAIAAGGVWLAADALASDRTAAALGGIGVAAAVTAAAAALAVGAARGSLSPAAPAAGLAAAVVVAAATWLALDRAAPGVRVTGWVGALVVFGHALDGVSTAVGVDLLGFGERSPLSRSVIEFAASLPTAPLLGAGWLFVVVKLAVATAVVWLFADYVREDPTEAYLLLGLIAAVGLGPGTYNLLLFAVAG